MPMPPPRVPDLTPENYIDLEKLGTADLATYISYPGMVDGSTLWPNWRGCTVSGEVVDFFDTLLESDTDYPNEYLVPVSNATLQALDQGWVFYSYQLEDGSTPDGRGEESLRNFFYVGKRPASDNALPVPQCKESHDLCIDPQVLDIVSTVTIVTVPYRAMQKDDKVKLRLDRCIGDFPLDPEFFSKTLTAEEAGQPLQWDIEPTALSIIQGGYALMSYSIEYVGLTVTTASAVQTLNIIAPTIDLLPALTVKDLLTDWLDPQDWLDGITVVIPLYPAIQIGDDVLLYVTGGLSPLVKTLRVDSSTIASGVLFFNVEYEWLFENRGKTVELLYQYARVGKAGTSEAFTLSLIRQQVLPPPEVVGAEAEDDEQGEYKGYIYASDAISGVTIYVPAQVDIGLGNTLKMHWEGYSETGSAVVYSTASDPRRFLIPAAAVPANMNKWVKVYYTLAPSGETGDPSIAYNLEVRPMVTGWPTLQAIDPLVSGNKLPIDEVPEEGALFELGAWPFMAEGQRVRIKAKGLLPDCSDKCIDLRIGADELVTKAEYLAGKLSVRVPKDFLLSLKLDELNLQITVETSFDDGFSYPSFPGLPDLTVISASSARGKIKE
jgi:hypothetical protein